MTFKIEEELLEKLDMYARSIGKTRSEIIRRALELYLIKEEKREPVIARRIRVYY